MAELLPEAVLISLSLYTWIARRGVCYAGDERRSASHRKGGMPTSKGVGKVCSPNVKRDGYRDSHEASVFELSDGGTLCLSTRGSRSNKGCNRASLGD